MYRLVRVLSILFLFIGATGVLFAGAKAELELELVAEATPRIYVAPVSGGALSVVLSDLISLPSDLDVKRYEFNIFDATGAHVYSEKKGQTRQRGAFGSIRWKGEEADLPQSLDWDGTYLLPDDPRNGQGVPDGDYVYQLVIINERGQEIESPPFGVTIDNTLPEVYSFLSTINLVFSPDGNRVKDTVTVRMISSREQYWEAQISNSAGNVVYSEVFENETNDEQGDVVFPQEYVWDGKDFDGQVQPEGEYAFAVIGKDHAGNQSTIALPRNIVISYTAEFATLTPVGGSHAFSPNDDGMRDILEVDISLYEEEGITNWALAVVSALDPETTLLYNEGEAPVISNIILDGKNTAEQVLPDGDYILILSLFDGSQEIANSEMFFRIDTEPPRLGLRLETAPVATAPGDPFYYGGADRSEVVISIIGEAAVDWRAKITDQDDKEMDIRLADIGMQSGRLNYTHKIDSPEALAMKDDLYTMVVYGYDDAGNYGASPPQRVIKDTRLGTVSATVEGEYLAAGSQGETAAIPIAMDYSIKEGASQFLLDILDSEDKIVRSVYKRQFFSTFEWDGFTNSNAIAADGEYTVRYRIVYYNGNTPEVSGVGPIILDGTKPVIRSLTSEMKFFSPDGDSIRDTITIEQDTVKEEGTVWVGEVVSADGTVQRTFDFGDEADAQLVWDGRSDNGDILMDGDYLYIIRGRDVAGNIAELSLPIIIGAGGGARWELPVTLSTSPELFSPDDDGVNDVLTINVTSRPSSGIKNWSLDILDPKGNHFKSLIDNGTGDPSAEITWDGLSDDGELVQAADTYRLVLTALDVFDNTGTSEAPINTDILIMVGEDGRIRIRIPSIYFAGFLSDLLLVQDDQLEANLKTARKLADILNTYSGYRILIEGHAAHVFWQDEELMAREHAEVLLPLSRARAENVRRALIILGVTRNRMRIDGLGGSNPVVPHSDRENIWKNRRVEFILDKEDSSEE